MSFDVTELDRRISNLIRFGVIDQADYTLGKVRVKAGDILTGWIPWLTQSAGLDATWQAPEVGEQVVILAPSGELNQGVVLAGLYQTAYPQPVSSVEKTHAKFKDGAVIEYDRATHHLKAILPTGGTCAITADGGITIIGDITHTGNINTSGTVTAAVDCIGNGTSLHNHVHGGVQSGGSNTGAPA